MKTISRSTEFIAATLLILVTLVSPATMAATIGAPLTYPPYKPYTYIYGTATNTVTSGQSPMNYNPSSGIESTLPFNYSKGSITFPLASVAFKNNLLNGSVKGTSEYYPTSELSLSSIQLLQSKAINYIAMTVTNSSNLATSTAYTADTSDTLNPTVPITSSSNLVFTGEVSSTCSAQTCFTLPTVAPFVIFHIVDTGGLLHAIEVTFAQNFFTTTTAGVMPQTPASSETVAYATGSTAGVANAQMYTVQANLGHILSLQSYTWTPSVLNGITYGFQTTTGTAHGTAESLGYSVQILNAFITPASVTVTGPTGAVVFNGTKATQTFSSAVTPTTAITPLTISNAAWTQINGVSFPFVYASAPTEILYADQLQIQYAWNYTVMPSTPSTLTFSGVNMNMSMNSLTPNMLDNIFVNGGSYATAIASWAGTTTGTLTASLTAGTSYYLQSLITYTGTEYDGLTSVPSVYQNPGSWLEANFWYAIVAIAAVIGIGGGVYLNKARELRLVPK